MLIFYRVNMRLFYIDSKDIVIAVVALIGTLIFIPTFTYAYFASDLETPDSIMNKNNTGLLLLDRNNKPFFQFYEAKNLSSIPLSQIPLLTQKAVIAAEDKDFYKHPGFSPKSIVGALIADLRRKDLSFGGSTITQQLVKSSLLHSNKDFLRKYQEVVLAEELERKYSKDQILEMYLNSVYFGEGSFGIDSAAKNYFGKNSQQLDLAESTILAAVLPAPSMLSPKTGNFDAAKKRQEIILNRMVEQKYISQAQADDAASEKLVFTNPDNPLNKIAPHFALMVRDFLISKYGEEEIIRSGYKVKTTLDLDLQQFAEEQVKKQVLSLEKDGVSNGAAVMMDPKTGEILAMVGSIDWFNSDFGQVNVATTPRQVGSSFKPIVYAAGIEEGKITAATVLKDVPTKFPRDNNPYSAEFLSGREVYQPKDYDGRYRGLVLARRALANSLNIPSVEVLSKVGIPNAVEMAQKLGITSLGDPSNYGLSLVLGAAEIRLVELTGAYSVFANGGSFNPPASIVSISDKNDQSVYSYIPNPQNVLSPQVAYIISSILSDNRTRAEEFGNLLNISRVAAVKTGTTEDYKDALTLGYTPQIAVGVWVGNNNNKPMDQVAGSMGAAPIWKALMEKYLEGKPVEAFVKPEDIVATKICKYNGLVFKGGSAGLALADDEASQSATSSGILTEYFIKGSEPTQSCGMRPPSSPKPSSNTSTAPSAPPQQAPSPIPVTSSAPPVVSPPPSPQPPPSVNNISNYINQNGDRVIMLQ